MGRSKVKEKGFAKVLFIDKGLSVVEVLKHPDLDVSERTLRKWIKDENWDKLRKINLFSRDNQISKMYDQLEALNQHIDKRDDKLISAKEVDSISKLTAAIDRLKNKVTVVEIVEVSRMFINFVKEIDFDKAKDITFLFDKFIQSKI